MITTVRVMVDTKVVKWHLERDQVAKLIAEQKEEEKNKVNL